MTSLPSFALEGGQLSVQYVRGRQMLRVVHADEGRRNGVEVPLRAFLAGLGIELAELAPDRLFLLFACPDGRPAGGLSDLVATFRCDEEAREAFRQIRLSAGYRNGWAELVALSADGRIRSLCWFGRPPARRRDDRSPASSAAAPGSGSVPGRRVSSLLGRASGRLARRAGQRGDAAGDGAGSQARTSDQQEGRGR